jgi:HlyD family secretion protein
MTDKNSFFKKHKKKIIVAAVVFVILLIIIINLSTSREKSVKVTIEKVGKEDLISIISASGEVKPKKNVNISAHLPGRIIKIGVEEGQRVKAGDFLLKLESTQYEANADRDRALIRSYQAELIKAEAVLKKDENFYIRQKKLFEEKLISREQLEAAEAQFNVSKAQYESTNFQIMQAQASLQSTLDNLEKTVFNSPIDGIITSLRVEEGEIALVGTMNNPGTVLMTIADLSVMEVEVDVDETDVVSASLGQKAAVTVDAFPETIINGTVTEIGSSALQTNTLNQESKDFKVVITLQDPPANLKPGLSASADIITTEKSQVLTVPISALVLKDTEEDTSISILEAEKQIEGVYVLEEGQAKFQPIEKGIMGEMKIEITSGLEEGMTVIVGPYSALRELKDGMLVEPEETKEF